MKSRKSIKLEDKVAFVTKVLERYDQDSRDRQDWMTNRIQRYAKLYGWLEPKHYPWPNASNQHVDMLMTQSQRTQDTLHNAVLASRPVMSAIALNKGDEEKGKQIDTLQDYQLFVEQPGEEKFGALIDSFVNDGRFIAFIPWVKEKRKARKKHALPLIPEGMDPKPFYEKFLQEMFPNGFIEPKGDGKYLVTSMKSLEDKPLETKAEFFVEEDRHFALIHSDKIIFDAPCLIPKPLEDIIVPSRCENLQPPSPSNPTGADHVIMIDWPSWDEIHRLYKKGYYDLLTDEDFNTLEAKVESEAADRPLDSQSGTPEPFKVLTDSLAGMEHGNAKSTSKVFTRLTYFGKWALGDDEFEEEVVARVILSPSMNIKVLARLRYLEEEFPREDLSRPRPFACSPAFIPIPGQFYGFGLPELLEHMHDLVKIILDQMIDKHTIMNNPFFFYRASSNMRPETIRMEPGTGYPLSNPQQDIHIPQWPSEDQTIALNLMATIQQRVEMASMQGALQMGAVPQGKASALRTSSNMMNVLQQGDARPERILRRFFRGVAEIYQQMHELNKVMLPPNKQYRIAGVTHAGADPYQVIKKPEDIGGMFQFDFKANALNTNKGAKAQILSQLLPSIVNGMTMQMGLVNQEKVYNILRDLIQAMGQDEHKYLMSPPNADVPKITAEQAMGQMVQGVLPQGMPAEGAQGHLQSLTMFQQDPRFAHLIQVDPAFALIFSTYAQQVQQLVMQEQQQAQMAQQFAGAMGGGGATGEGGPEGMVDPGAGQMQPQGQGQIMDESLPGAKGMV